MSFAYLLIYIFFSFSVGYPPFSESSGVSPLNDQIIKGLYTFPNEFWSEVSESVKDLIRKMMCIDPVKRLTIDGVLEHPWLADDHNNTVRVNEIMYPPTISTLPSAVTSSKRPVCDDDGDDESTTVAFSTKSSDGKSTETNNSTGRSKRVKH